ncbi:MAG TPA: hypothetical protein VFE24_08335 [Pirellulales bacterium]|jgi:hypothetical protein|nr:hypothetical protein [Pirellulales bacterium]
MSRVFADLMTNFRSQDLLFFGLLVMAGVLLLAAIAAGVWKEIRKKEIDATLKREMIERGMSAEDIVRVLSADSEGKQPAKPPKASDPSELPRSTEPYPNR